MRIGNNIRQRADGRYEARYIKGHFEDGKAIWGYCYGKTYEEAEEKRNIATGASLREMNLLILGCGDQGREVQELAKGLNIFKKISFLDDDESKKDAIGKCSNFRNYLDIYPIAIPAVGDNQLRCRWAIELAQLGFVVPTFIHPSANVSSSAKIGTGTVICAGATIGLGAVVGDGCIIDSGAIVERHAVVPDWTLVECGTIFNG